MRTIANWAFSLLAAFLLVSTCPAQEPVTVADTTSRGETIIAGFVSGNDMPGLADYARQLLDAARAKNRIIAEQDRSAREYQAEHQELKIHLHELDVQIAFQQARIADQIQAQQGTLAEFRKSLESERQAQEAALKQLIQHNNRSGFRRCLPALLGFAAGIAFPH